jgi:DNA-binding XRE family transcriptional regulator
MMTMPVNMLIQSAKHCAYAPGLDRRFFFLHYTNFKKGIDKKYALRYNANKRSYMGDLRMMQQNRQAWHEMERKALAYRGWLVQARLSARMTQTEVADACGISRSAYQKYEYGQRTPRKSKREELQKVLALHLAGFDRLQEDQ